MTNDLQILAAEIAAVVDKDFDFPFKKRMEGLAIDYRATLLKQEFDRNGRFPTSSEESVILPVKVSSASECGCECSIECDVFRTVEKVPRPIRRNIAMAPFLYVGTSNQTRSFTFVKPEEVESILEGTRFLKDSPLYAYYNDYIYIFGDSGGKVAIRDPFGDPREILKLKDCNGNLCDANINIDNDMKRTIKLMIFEELRLFNKLPEEKQPRLNEDN